MLRSPIAGVVEQLNVHTIGRVVTPAQHLMIVVPDAQRLMVEARLANRDVGFVHDGQPAKVKVETFTFTRYGLIDGRVIEVSRDVAQAGPAPVEGPDTAKASPSPESPTYMARWPDRISAPGHSGDGRDQDRRTLDHQLLAVAACAWDARKPARR